MLSIKLSCHGVDKWKLIYKFCSSGEMHRFCMKYTKNSRVPAGEKKNVSGTVVSYMCRTVTMYTVQETGLPGRKDKKL